jgi:uncharacterized membrane protein
MGLSKQRKRVLLTTQITGALVVVVAVAVVQRVLHGVVLRGKLDVSKIGSNPKSASN